jgi:hypothetical protein
VLRTLAICQVTTFQHLHLRYHHQHLHPRYDHQHLHLPNHHWRHRLDQQQSLLAAMTAMEATMAAMEMGKETAKGKGEARAKELRPVSCGCRMALSLSTHPLAILLRSASLGIL